jgi:hypothetical protein
VSLRTMSSSSTRMTFPALLVLIFAEGMGSS